MSLPAGVTVGPGRRRFITQRGYWCGPSCAKKLCSDKCCKFTSCMFAALGSLLEHAGYRLPVARKLEAADVENFVLTLHKASGAPLRNSTNVRRTKWALDKLLPASPVHYAKLTKEEIWRLLGDKGAVRIIVRCDRIPSSFGRPAGTADGLHAVSFQGRRIVGGERRTFWMDPMGRPSTGYEGLFVDFDKIPFRTDSAGKVATTFTVLSAAAPASPAKPLEHADVDLRQLFDLLGFKGKIGPETPVVDPRDGKTATIAATNQLRCIPRDSKHHWALVASSRLSPPSPQIVLVEVARVKGGPKFGNPS
jgi:hypothetical protein